MADTICEKVPERVRIICKDIGPKRSEAGLKDWISLAAEEMMMGLISDLTARTPFKSIIFADSFSKALDTKREDFMNKFEVLCS
jgi:hypothetical protein